VGVCCESRRLKVEHFSIEVLNVAAPFVCVCVCVCVCVKSVLPLKLFLFFTLLNFSKTNSVDYLLKSVSVNSCEWVNKCSPVVSVHLSLSHYLMLSSPVSNGCLTRYPFRPIPRGSVIY